MPTKFFPVAAAAAATISALLLTGSSPNYKNLFVDPAAHDLSLRGQKLSNAAHYGEARELFIQAATLAQAHGDGHAAAMNWSNAGACSLVELQFGFAGEAFRKARAIAENSGSRTALASALNNIANLYIHMGEPEGAMRTAREALDGPARSGDAVRLRPLLNLQLALALAQQNRYNDALPVYREAVADLVSRREFTMAARALSSLGDESLKVDRLDQASAALDEGLRLVRNEEADALPSVLDGLAKLRARQGRKEEAAVLFDKALAAPLNTTPKWKLLADRARFRLDTNNLPGALADFRSARTIAARMRLDIVPADQDRVGLESGLSEVIQGLVEAGNRLARESGDAAILNETFDAAEQDRQWSLRALLPGLDDWRSRLPGAYWNLLARYQALERTAIVKGTPAAEQEANGAGDELKRMEAQAGRHAENESSRSALSHLGASMDAEAVLLSFHIAKGSAWVWAIDRKGAGVFPLPAFERIARESEAFARAVREGASDSDEAGRALYASLFRGVPETYLSRRKWMLELDGPLYSVPFAALVVNGPDEKPVYLVEKAILQTIPGALLLRRGAATPTGQLLAIGDPIYNGADPRRNTKKRPELALPRLPNTTTEVQACSRAWGASRTRTMTGVDATAEQVQAAMQSNPDIIHFATHVVASPADFRTGLIALSLDPNGAMGMLGPRDIVARPLTASLVVMDGCHSSRADALPGAGLMGLTRAWIGAGASAVLATLWDIPDDSSQWMMETFYRTLAAGDRDGPAGALRKAQLTQLRKDGGHSRPLLWAGYYLQSRTQ